MDYKNENYRGFRLTNFRATERKIAGTKGWKFTGTKWWKIVWQTTGATEIKITGLTNEK